MEETITTETQPEAKHYVLDPPEAALEALRQRVLARYTPVGNKHTPELEDHYVSVSKLVGETAENYAAYILALSPDDGERYYSYKGNTLADQALVDSDAHELRFEIALGIDGWRMTGHCDGMDATPHGVAIHEHKAFATPTARKRELARRQGALYLAMAWELYSKSGVKTFKSAAYKEKVSTFTWPEGALPLGVIVSVAPEKPPASSEGYLYNASQLEELLAFYMAKAKHIVTAVQANDLKYAKAWDDSPAGIQEQRLEFGRTPIPDDQKIVELLKKYRELTAIDSDCYKQKEDLKPEIKAWLQEHGLRKASIAGYNVTLSDVAGGTYTRKASTQLRVTED